MGLLGLMAPERAGWIWAWHRLTSSASRRRRDTPACRSRWSRPQGSRCRCSTAIGDEAQTWPRCSHGASVAIGYPGRKFVADGDTADFLLLANGDDLHLVDAGDVTLTRRESVDPFRRLFSVEWSPSNATKQVVDWGDAKDRGAVLAAAQLVGLGQRAIDMAVAYAKERKQFGKPIGSYQAVKHLIASAQVAVEFARPVVHAAAAELPLGTLAAQARVSHAKIAAAQAADLAARTSVQVHGAMGMTWEIDLHFFLKRVLALRNDWGTPVEHRDRMMRRIETLPTGPDLTFASEMAAAG